MQQYTWFYPGSMWSKRIFHLIVIALFGFTAFAGTVQAYLLSDLHRLSDLGHLKGLEVSKQMKEFLSTGKVRPILIKYLGGSKIEPTVDAFIDWLKRSHLIADRLFWIVTFTLSVTGVLALFALKSLVWVFLDIRHGDSGARMKALLKSAGIFAVTSFLLLTICWKVVYPDHITMEKGGRLNDYPLSSSLLMHPRN